MPTLWFKRKSYGYGWVPSSWQGWMTVFFYVVLLTHEVTKIIRNSNISFKFPFGSIVMILVSTFFLIVVCYKKGEKPRWSWGEQNKDEIKETKN